MTELDKKKGRVKFYSTEKGYGFLHSEEKTSDYYFHISQIIGAEPPKQGDTVEFVVGMHNGKPQAQHISILANEKVAQSERQLDGFPCIRGQSVRGFIVTEDLGHITIGMPVFGFFRAYTTVNRARDDLIWKAQRMGANGIINFVFHNDRRREKNFIGKGWHYEDNFWDDSH